MGKRWVTATKVWPCVLLWEESECNTIFISLTALIIAFTVAPFLSENKPKQKFWSAHIFRTKLGKFVYKWEIFLPVSLTCDGMCLFSPAHAVYFGCSPLCLPVYTVLSQSDDLGNDLPAPTQPLQLRRVKHLQMSYISCLFDVEQPQSVLLRD